MQWQKSADLVAVLAAFSCSGLGGCSSDDSGGDPYTNVQDNLGRICTVRSAADVTCDVQPAPNSACASGTSACFTLCSTGDASGPAAICGSCCGQSGSTGSKTDCSLITCGSDSDCPDVYGRCVSGQCRH